MINKIDNSPTFGWRYRMHSSLLESAAKKTNLQYKHYNIIELMKDMVERPDFDETFLCCQKHFYYPNSKIKSFFDLTGNNNAQKAYLKHVKNFKTLFKDYPMYGLSEAARALHYLQDITQPQHIKNTCVIKKILEKNTHKKFEQHALNKSKSLIKNSHPVKLNSTEFEDLFEETAKLSTKNRVPTKNNPELWTAIAYDGTNLAMSATERFLTIVKRFIV